MTLKNCFYVHAWVGHSKNLVLVEPSTTSQHDNQCQSMASTLKKQDEMSGHSFVNVLHVQFWYLKFLWEKLKLFSVEGKKMTRHRYNFLKSWRQQTSGPWSKKSLAL